MNLEIVAELVRMMEQSTLSVMEVEQNGLRVHLECDGSQGSAASPQRERYVSPTAAQAREEEEQAEPQSEAGAAVAVGKHEIKSPMVGTFHEIKDGRIDVGTALKKGDPVCVIEAMKVMNEILMEEDGVITWKAVSEGEMVEFGQMLFMYD